MNNRARMVNATLLCRIFGIDWRVGERWYSQYLIDHHRTINEGNWLWVVGLAPFS